MSALPAPEAWRRAVRAVAKVQRMKRSDILVPRGWSAKRARHLAAYVACVAYDVPQRRLAPVIGAARSGLQRAIRTIEDQRDDPGFDARVALIEQELGA